MGLFGEKTVKNNERYHETYDVTPVTDDEDEQRGEGLLSTLRTPGVGSRRNIGIETSVFVIGHMEHYSHRVWADSSNSE